MAVHELRVLQRSAKPGHTDLTVRSRLRSDFEHLREPYIPALGAVVEHGGTNYQYRAKLSHAALAEAMSTIVQDISYSNFKNAVADQQGRARAKICGEVWQALWDLKETTP